MKEELEIYLIFSIGSIIFFKKGVCFLKKQEKYFTLMVAFIILNYDLAFSNQLNFFAAPSYSTSFSQKENMFDIDAGINFELNISKYSAIGLSYEYVYNSYYYSHSSKINIYYKNYFLGRYPTKTSKDIVYPFFSLSFNNFIKNHNSYLPGIRLALGIDFAVRKRFTFWDPITLLTYAISQILSSKQLFSIIIFTDVYFSENDILLNAGGIISTGFTF